MKRTSLICEEQTLGRERVRELLEAICMDTADLVDADLVSIWFFRNSNAAIECACAYDAQSGGFSDGQIIRQAMAPAYFRHIVENNTLIAPDVLSHPALGDLRQPYFEPLGIKSLMDFIVHDRMTPTGVICCENRRTRRDWNEKDLNALRAIATLASYHLRNLSSAHASND